MLEANQSFPLCRPSCPKACSQEKRNTCTDIIVQIVSPLLALSNSCFEAGFIETVASLSKFLFQHLPSFRNSFVWHRIIRWYMVYWFVLLYGLLILKFETVSSLSKFRLFPHLETPLSDTGSSVDAALWKETSLERKQQPPTFALLTHTSQTPLQLLSAKTK